MRGRSRGELGLSDREQDIVHTAALLHDIGKFIFPDSILFAVDALVAEDWRSSGGTRSRARGSWPGWTATARWPRSSWPTTSGSTATATRTASSGEQIPLAARIIAVADTYDVMTARDSYRRPVSSREAIEELRRVSGAQLDGLVVETFIGLLEKRSVTFRHADDADFERELNLDRRIRDYAQPRIAAA